MVEPNTGYYCKVIADSINPAGVRLTTLEVCFPRFILAEINTHRVFSRNSASSRAIPVGKQLQRVKEFPFVPESFPINKPGMSATEYITAKDSGYKEARDAWLYGRDKAIETAERLLALNIHKQIANRVIEPYTYHTAVITATEWDNFYNLRISPFAQPEIIKTAELMKSAMNRTHPRRLEWGELHLPYVLDSELMLDRFAQNKPELLKVSAGRAAAVTLLNMATRDVDKDIERCEKLIANGHMSPLEHPAEAHNPAFSNYASKPSNFNDTWVQFRKRIPNEAVYVEQETKAISA